MNFLSIRPRFHSSLTSPSVHPPAGSPRLLSPSLPLPVRLPEKSSTLSASRPRVGSPLRARTPHPPLTSLPAPTQGAQRAPFPREEGKGPTAAENAGGGEAGQGGLHGEPQLPRVSRGCARPRAPPGPRLAARSRSPWVSGTGRPPRGSPVCQSRRRLGVWGRVGRGQRRGNKPLWLE